MTLRLKWTSLPERRNIDLPIFDLTLVQEENEFAKAILLVDVKTSLPPTDTEAIIEENSKDILFKGRLVGTPLIIEGNLAHIELIAMPSSFSEKIKTLQETCRIHPYWDPLWVPPEKQGNFQSLQDIRTASLYCDRRTGDLRLSDWFEGRKTLSVNFFPKSLYFQLVKVPLKACTVRVHAHWVQKDRGVACLNSKIRRTFPRLKVNTYTKESLLQKWPEAGRRLGRSGYWVLKSRLKPIHPMPSHYPLTSFPLSLKDDKGQAKNFRAQRSWFSPSLWLGWKINQRRKETLTLTLNHSFQPIVPGEGEHKSLAFTLHNINPDPKSYPWEPDVFYKAGTKVTVHQKIYKCTQDHLSSLSFEEDEKFWRFKKVFHTPLGNPARSSFFLTDRGYLAAEHAMERAKVELAKSARCFKITVDGPWDAMKEVTTDMSLILTDPRLPNGKIQGKVVHHSLHAKGETGERFGRVVVLCALGAEVSALQQTKGTPQYVEEGYCEPATQIFENSLCQTPSGLSYFRYDNQNPPVNFTSGTIVQNIHLLHGPEDQEQNMQECLNKPSSLLEKTLAQNPTRLRIFLKDIRTKDSLEHEIQVSMASPWSAPKSY